MVQKRPTKEFVAVMKGFQEMKTRLEEERNEEAQREADEERKALEATQREERRAIAREKRAKLREIGSSTDEA